MSICTDIIGLNPTAPPGRRLTDTHWHYDPTDPLAITIVFVQPEYDSEWTISRDVLGDSYLNPTTLGDIHIRRDGGQLYLRLIHNRHYVDIIFPADFVWDYLRVTHKAIPPCRNAGNCTGGCFECSLLDTDLDTVLAQH